MLQKTNNTVLPRALIMSLLNAPDRSTLTIGQLISAGSLFEVEAATIRMAVTRLTRDQLICSVDRGVYRAGEKATSLRSEVQSWRSADKKMKPWGGDWFIALSNHLGRTNKAQLRSMIRAFHLYGFVEIELGVWLRPANLVQDINQLRLKLIDLGMDESAYLMGVSAIAGEQDKKWRSVWPLTELEAGYEKMIETLETSLNSLPQMTSDAAAKESLMVGESAIRLINLDPLLPAEITGTTRFNKLVTTMDAYDKAGQTHWRKFLSS